MSACNEGKPPITTVNSRNVHTRVCMCVHACVWVSLPTPKTEEIKSTHPAVGLTSHPAEEHTGSDLLRLQKINEVAARSSCEGC